MSAGATVLDDRVHVNSVTSPKTRSTLMAMPLRDRTMPSGDGTTPPGDIDVQVCEIGSEFGRRVEELGREIAAP